MLTRIRFVPPTLTGYWNVDGPNLLRAINNYFLVLNQKSALEIDEARIRAAQGVAIPATAVASTDPNTQDDYAEASSSPAVTSGTGAFTSVLAALTSTKIGRLVSFRVTVTITTNGTAATAINIALPFTAAVRTSVGGFNRNAVNGLAGYVNGSTLSIYKYDGTYPGADGVVLDVQGQIEV